MTKLLSIQAAAELLSISPWTIRAYIRQGKLRPVRIGRRVLLQEEEIQRFVGVAAPRDRPSPAISRLTQHPEVRNE